MAGRGKGEKAGSKLLRLFSFEDHLGLWLRGEFRPVDDSPAAEMGGVLFRLGHIVTVGQENGAKASHSFKTSDEMREKLRRVNHPIPLRPSPLPPAFLLHIE